MQAGKGNSVAQYGIIIVLVAIAGIGVFTSLGQNILKQLSDFAAMMANNNAIVNQNTTSTSSTVANITPGSLGGSPSNPVTVSNGDGTSVIDFGDYILDGIPENFDEFIESNGTSGGTDQLASVYSQIAEQLKEEGNEDAANHFEDLANLATFMSDIQKEVESSAAACGEDMNCFKDAVNSHTTIEVPENIQDLIPNFDSTTSLSDAIEQLDLGMAADNQTGFLSFLNTSTDSIGEKMYDIMQDIQGDSGISDELKAVTIKLYEEIGDTSFDQIGQTNANTQPFASKMLSMLGFSKYERTEYDVIEGDNEGDEEFIVTEDNINDVGSASEGTENLAEEIIETVEEENQN